VLEILRQWLRLLVECGIDLPEYVRNEEDMHGSGMPGTASVLDFSLTYSHWRVDEQAFLVQQLPVRICGFKFGDTPEVCDIDWDVDVEKLAGEFWQIMEAGPTDITRMPGSWID
jgi:hypothetical protein